MDDFTAEPVRQSAFYDLENDYPSCLRVDSTLKDHKLTAREYQDMLGAQGFRCAICYASFADVDAHIDHDHKTGKVRGVLCRTCNNGLGLFHDNIVRLEAAAKYLRRSQQGGQKTKRR